MTRQVKIFLTVLPPPARADNAFSYVCYSCKTNKRVHTLFTHWKEVIIQPPFVKSNLTSENVSIKMPLPDRFISFFLFLYVWVLWLIQEYIKDFGLAKNCDGGNPKPKWKHINLPQTDGSFLIQDSSTTQIYSSDLVSMPATVIVISTVSCCSNTLPPATTTKKLGFIIAVLYDH